MAGVLTLSQMVDEVVDNVAKSSTAQTKSGKTLSTMATRYLNRAQVRIARKEDFLFAIATAATIANQKDYALPSNIRSLYSLRLENGFQSVKLVVVMPWEFDGRVPKPNELTSRQPFIYIPYKASNTFELFPIPDIAYTMRLRYSYWPTELTISSQTSDYSYMDDVLLAYATSQMWRWLQEYKDADAWNKEADSLFALAIEAEREFIPDWAPSGKGFSTSPEAPLGEYYNNPFITDDPSVRAIS